jgi:protein arginine N-methyltransferase 1
MGYFLLYESMLDTVIFARDKWLVPNGLIFPDKAVLYLAAMEDAQYKRDRIDFWDNVYGFDYSTIRDIAIREPIVDTIEGKSIVSDSVPILDIDILTCTKESLSFQSQFCLTALRFDYVHGLVAYFECAFTQIPRPIGFSTSPMACYTHWKQTLFYLEDTLHMTRGSQIYGCLTCKPNKKNNRDLDITISVKMNGQYTVVDKEYEYYLR